tara:strand:+ start:210 stop:1025 length:816 start_codon:yes stop_codon:yes gene_type:complete
MKYFKNIFDFYIQSSLHVALAVYALIRITFLKLNISYDEAVVCFGFYGTVVGYNFIKYDELARIKKVKLSNTFQIIIALSFVSALAAFYYYLELKINTKLIGFGALLVTIFYTLPFFPNKKNMRNWSGIKIYLVAFAWVGVTVLLPVINAELDFSIVVILKSIQRFVFIFVLMLIFEIIDLPFDALKLNTIPQKIGINRTKQLSYIGIGLFLFLEYFKPNSTLSQFAITSLISLILGGFTYFANSKRNKYYSSFCVESVPVIWLLLLLIFG